ncbi:uncharacterized protein AMSG_00874 [Thecamonas trahens ATCC 50062]|uniref:J domain-containing protein n=1 Tax=Thecamonas trahens ATCC 50062 TaxID=461836 RepID=A0A0L0DIA9_THETB|nr:hypothetical protein AMSG_00874 [Thecamonas trahens ATCC 50062]KNC52047.1 hypothetical protein AMSG_00874 [Thecamonas trahens ATCC 50062]|eukprot:XP_013762053.1 hypothetical protein AMSG_00874 [Thecamonas trahens ATCC 50062]
MEYSAEEAQKAIADVVERDLYEELELVAQPPPTDKAIRKQYRSLARKVHPDRNPGDEAAAAVFHALHRAYEVLSHPQLRIAYDSVLAANASKKRKRQEMQAERRAAADEMDAREEASRKAKRARHKADAQQAAKDVVDAKKRAALKDQIASLRAMHTPLASPAPSPPPSATASPAPPGVRAIALKWNAKVGGPDRVKELLGMFGNVDSWLHKPPKPGKSKHKAVAVMASQDEAEDVMSTTAASSWASRGIAMSWAG